MYHDCSPPTLHSDVESNSILLDTGFEAHAADFNLAKFLNGNAGGSERMSAIAGSYGYIASEYIYAYTLKVDEKSDDTASALCCWSSSVNVSRWASSATA